MEITGLIVMLASIVWINTLVDVDSWFKIVILVISVPIIVVATRSIIAQKKQSQKIPKEQTGKALLQTRINKERTWLREYVRADVMTKLIKDANPVDFIKRIEIPSLEEDIRVSFGYSMASFGVLTVASAYLIYANNSNYLIHTGIITAVSSLALLFCVGRSIYYLHKHTRAKDELQLLIKKGSSKKKK